MNDSRVPQPVINAAKNLSDIYGENLFFIGTYNGEDVYLFEFPDNVETGFPFLYFYNVATQKVTELTGPEALDVVVLI